MMAPWASRGGLKSSSADQKESQGGWKAFGSASRAGFGLGSQLWGRFRGSGIDSSIVQGGRWEAIRPGRDGPEAIADRIPKGQLLPFWKSPEQLSLPAPPPRPPPSFTALPSAGRSVRKGLTLAMSLPAGSCPQFLCDPALGAHHGRGHFSMMSEWLFLE